MAKHGHQLAPIGGKTPAEKLRTASEDWETNGIWLLPWENRGGPQNVDESYLFRVRLANGCCPGDFGHWMDLFSPEKGVNPANVWDRIGLEIKQRQTEQGIDG